MSAGDELVYKILHQLLIANDEGPLLTHMTSQGCVLKVPYKNLRFSESGTPMMAIWMLIGVMRSWRSLRPSNFDREGVLNPLRTSVFYI